ncbi:hypothetical protein CEP53_007159 [Fusarium sp. AF-6]|nr:hypothetical protein CEP53_007159 [Fusarium sp. AF-6]
MAFIIYKYYDYSKQESAVRAAVEAKKALPAPMAYSQAIILISKEMMDAMKAFFAQTPSCIDVPELTEMHPLQPPYIWWYHRRKSHDIQSLPKRQAQLVMALVDWIEGSYGSLFDAIGDQLHRAFDLQVDQIRDVVWNDRAFNNLVADEDMKELILALVTNQLETEKGTDLIDNKGNGLIMLLHGSPGTGKTFTAESVAEIAKKPLYPVTCGDIGTEPQQVERYLESVFHLGKIWDCVVLLDEAEVFLEQRTLQDLKRNALVSVFLRALEYYEGILILTTNRVGTFDEAFKSRIQLALRYERLQGYQRKQIWRNFFGRLKEIGEEDKIDFDDIQLNLDELARYEMNGRQIRNSITTARQLAKYKGRKMAFSHLKRAITVADKFDRYLADVQEGIDEDGGGRGEDGRYSDESLARQDGDIFT